MRGPIHDSLLGPSLLLSLVGCAAAPSEAPAEAPAPVEHASPSVAAPEQDGEPVAEDDADAELDANSGAALIALADRITHVELRRGEDETILRFDDAVRDELVESLHAATLADSLSATSPPWPNYWVILHVEGRAAPFVASIVSMGGLRINARDPYSLRIADEDGAPDFENIKDVGYSERMYDAVVERVGPPQGKEYESVRPRPRPPSNKRGEVPDGDLTNPFD